MSGGFGLGPFGVSPFGTLPLTLSEEPPIVVNSSRNIDGKTKRYTLDSDGNYEGMDDVSQRVLLLSSYALEDESTLIGTDFASRRDASIRKALETLTTGREPAIRIDEIETTTAAGTSYTRVVYTKLLTNTQSSVTL